MPSGFGILGPYLPNGGTVADVNIPIADHKYPGQIGHVYKIAVKDADGKTRYKAFQVVKTNATLATATVDGSCLWWSDQDAYEVTTLATNRGRVAGVALRVASVSSVIMIQVGGRHPGVHLVAAPVAAAAATGNYIIPSATAAKFDCLALGTAPTHRPLGIATGAATGDFAPCFITLDGSIPG
jgi:hypothetical protein